MTNATKTTNLAKKIARLCFPGYTGRKIRVEVRETYSMADYWDGGTRRTPIAYDLTGTAEFPCRRAEDVARIPQNAEAHATFTIPAGVAIVERAYFCGKDCGITIYVNPAADKAGLLSA